MNKPRISVVVPFHWMKNWQFFLSRCLDSIEKQSFKDYEVILTKAGNMPINSNKAMESANGELVKVLYMDDYLAHPDALQIISDEFDSDHEWLVTGCLHQKGLEVPHSLHLPTYNRDIHLGINTIGSPSVVTLRRETLLYFDPNLSFLLDCDLYKRYYNLYGEPQILNDLNVVIGIHDGQTSHIMSEEEKQSELNYMKNKVI